MMIRKIILNGLCLFFALWLTACDSDSDSNVDAVENVLCTIELAGNYAASTSALETNLFNPDSTSTFHFSFTSFFTDIFNNTHTLKLYFLKSDDGLRLWDVYAFIDDIEAHVVGGSLGSQGQAKAQLMFDAEGALVRVLPADIMINNVILSFSTYRHNFKILFPEDTNTHLFSDSVLSTTVAECVIES